MSVKSHSNSPGLQCTYLRGEERYEPGESMGGRDNICPCQFLTHMDMGDKIRSRVLDPNIITRQTGVRQRMSPSENAEGQHTHHHQVPLKVHPKSGRERGCHKDFSREQSMGPSITIQVQVELDRPTEMLPFNGQRSWCNHSQPYFLGLLVTGILSLQSRLEASVGTKSAS